MPSVVGEIVAGIILGPTILGYFFPNTFDLLFPFVNYPEAYNSVSIAMDSIISISLVMLLFVAGLEVQLPMVIERGKNALIITFFGMLIPICAGYAVVWSLPDMFVINDSFDKNTYSLFIGIVLSITALPVIARIMMDMNIFKTRMGMTIIASAMVIDLLGWLIFSVILSVIDSSAEKKSIWQTVISIISFGSIMLTVGTKIVNSGLPWVQSKFSWPGGVLSLSLGSCFLASAFTESIGVHSVLGAFIMGITIGDSVNLKNKTNEIIHQFINNVFAPIFFVSIGLYVNFIENFDIKLICIILIISYLSKILGSKIGSSVGGIRGKEGWAIAMAMNTHGALEIILATLALEAGLINSQLLVAIVITVILSIITTVPLLKAFLPKKIE
ncbi:Na/H antiporter [Ichthyobacterium seriolicida]|uniref:Na/H antiporter n=2 Tax=Ichthyobacterium seriolicida TaxID=242600 RepID=A0A1J1E044_9FLAO|nr:Na/H antiporter [Ichthyobacterium seriolicida]